MSVQDQFEAAVKVIQNLPKNGPYQPSHEMMLLFYSYYKQATIGPCNIPKPAFWDVINKAKYNAWVALGNISKEDAMKRYVEEIKKIIETMSFSSDVEQLLEVLGPFYEYVKDDESSTSKIDINSNGMNALLGQFSDKLGEDKLQMLTLKANELNESMTQAQQLIVQGNSEFQNSEIQGSEFQESESENSREEITESRAMIDTDTITSEDDLIGDPDESSDELFEDPLEDYSMPMERINSAKKPDDLIQITQLQQQMASTVQQLQRDMDQVLSRVSFVENLLLKTKAKDETKQKSVSSFPFSELSGSTTFLLVAWPFVVQVLFTAARYASKKG